jgi:hypothetical protein
MMERLLDKAYKWMESFLLLVALALMLTACKSQPPMKLDATTDKQTDTKTDTQVSDSSYQHTQEMIKELSSSWWQKLEEITSIWEHTEYSPPDSTGRQYPTSVTTGSVNSSSQEEKRDTSQTDTKIETMYAEITNIQSRMQQIEQEVSTVKAERKETLSWWQSPLMYLGGIGFLIIIVRLIWRKLP